MVVGRATSSLATPSPKAASTNPPHPILCSLSSKMISGSEGYAEVVRCQSSTSGAWLSVSAVRTPKRNACCIWGSGRAVLVFTSGTYRGLRFPEQFETIRMLPFGDWIACIGVDGLYTVRPCQVSRARYQQVRTAQSLQKHVSVIEAANQNMHISTELDLVGLFRWLCVANACRPKLEMLHVLCFGTRWNVARSRFLAGW